jgi:predicted amino acid dehydrogenase
VASFAFVTHPLSLDDVARYEPDVAGKSPALVRKILSWMPEYTAARVTGVRAPDGRETDGWFIMVPLLPDQLAALPHEEAYARIGRAVEIGAQLGASICGLGAFTAVVGDGGVTVAQRASIPVTTGNSLTIAAGVKSALRAADEMEIDLADATVAVAGATGSIGSACAALLAPHVRRIIAVARNATRVRNFVAAHRSMLPCSLEGTTELATAVRASDLILTATSSTSEIIEPQDLRTGAVICELSLPHDVGRRVARERPDVLVTEGGNLRVPGDFRMERVREPGRPFDLGLSPGTALACISETMTLALAGRCESYTLGRGIDLAKVREIDALATEAGFALADMRAFDVAITPDAIAAMRAARDARRVHA